MEIPIVPKTDTLWLDKFIEITEQLTKPAIIKGFFDVTPFESLCNCDGSSKLFDDLVFPATSGNMKFNEWASAHHGQALEVNLTNGGEYYRDNACNGKDDYIFFDAGNQNYWDANTRKFAAAVGKMLRLDETIRDPGYDEWMYEFFLGYSSEEYPIPFFNTSGSPPHRFPVLNYYYQICGKKRWTIADYAAKVTYADGSPLTYAMLHPDDIRRFMEHPSAMVGFTEPGDLLVNPPWLWHYVQTARGFNFAAAYKQDRYGLLVDILNKETVLRWQYEMIFPGGKTPRLFLSYADLPGILHACIFGITPGSALYRASGIPVSAQEFRSSLLYGEHPFIDAYRIFLRACAQQLAVIAGVLVVGVALGAVGARCCCSKRKPNGAPHAKAE